MAKEKSEYYIEPVEFMTQITEWLDQRKIDPDIQWSEDLCKKFMRMIEGMSHNKSFSRYTYIDEMKDEALLHIMKYGHNYDPTKINEQTGKPYPPFSYYNRIIWQAFVSIINKEKRQQDIKREYLLKNYTLSDELFLDGADGHAHALDMMANMYDEKRKDES